jgi:breakpoint cluster region protein
MQLVKDPLEAMNLGEEQMRLLFSSISEIRSFHCDMLGHLRKDFDSYSEQQQYGRTLKKYIPFFKLYTDYILNAESAQRLLQELTRSNKEVAEVCRRYTETTAKIAHNELLQPTFRIARYEMLFQEIVKKTPLRHPDHTQLTEAQATFKKILTQVNDEVDKILRRNRLNQLEQ